MNKKKHTFLPVLRARISKKANERRKFAIFPLKKLLNTKKSCAYLERRKENNLPKRIAKRQIKEKKRYKTAHEQQILLYEFKERAFRRKSRSRFYSYYYIYLDLFAEKHLILMLHSLFSQLKH